MQMLLSTATKVASLTNANAPTQQTLQNPPVILPLSAWYLAELVKRFQNAGLAAAAYNCGPSAVDGWLKRNQNLELDEFVERIPYRETREYVKKVLGDYFFYRQLWRADKNPVPFSLQLPKSRSGIEF
jgi:soluble lytic murein transglycosylase